MVVADERPTARRAHDGGVGARGVRVALFGIAFLAGVLLLVLAATDAEPSDLVLPALAIGSFWVLWLVVHLVIGAAATRIEARRIDALFDNEIWDAWRYEPDDWSAEMERRYGEPEVDPGDARFGLLVAGGIGFVVALVLVVLSFVAMPDGAPAFVVPIAAAVAIGLFAVAGLQPRIDGRRQARAHAAAAGHASPAVWFGESGMYHDADGYTSFDDLSAVADRTKSAGTIVFTVRQRVVYRPGHTSQVETDVAVRVPTDATERAQRLVRRYRTDRLAAG